MAESSSASANFMKSLKAVASKDWNKSRTSRNPFEVNVPTGVYTGQISKVTLVASKTDQTPIVTFVFVVVDHAEYNGEQLRVSHFIKGSARSTISEALNRMFQSFQALGYDTDNVPIDNLHILASKATEEKRFARVGVTDSADGTRKFVNTVGKVTDTISYSDNGDDAYADIPKAEVPPEDDDDEEDEDDDEDEDDEENDDSDDDFEVWETGDECDYKPSGSRKLVDCKIASSNEKKRTATLVREDNGKTYKNISWDDLLTATDEE